MPSVPRTSVTLNRSRTGVRSRWLPCKTKTALLTAAAETFCQALIMSSIPNATAIGMTICCLCSIWVAQIRANHRVFVHVHSKGFKLLGSLWPSRKRFAEMVLSTEGQEMLPQFGIAVPDTIMQKARWSARLKFAATDDVHHELSTWPALYGHAFSPLNVNVGRRGTRATRRRLCQAQPLRLLSQL